MFFYICGGICLATNILGSLLIFEKEDDTSIVDIKEEEGKQKFQTLNYKLEIKTIIRK